METNKSYLLFVNTTLSYIISVGPSAPQYPLLELHEPDYVEVQWKPPVHTNGIILHYYIRYRSSDVSQKLEIKHTENGTIDYLQMNPSA